MSATCWLPDVVEEEVLRVRRATATAAGAAALAREADLLRGVHDAGLVVVAAELPAQEPPTPLPLLRLAAATTWTLTPRLCAAIKALAMPMSLKDQEAIRMAPSLMGSGSGRADRPTRPGS